jgi:hypothetical protein
VNLRWKLGELKLGPLSRGHGYALFCNGLLHFLFRSRIALVVLFVDGDGGGLLAGFSGDGLLTHHRALYLFEKKCFDGRGGVNKKKSWHNLKIAQRKSFVGVVN